jgi:microcystin degradation protein MlrC
MLSESHNLPWNAGNSAVLQVASMVVVVTSRPVSLYDRSLFFAVGQNPQQFNLVVVKSPHCQPHFFESWASKLLNVDAPGSTSANLKSLGHRLCQRPMFPLDEEVDFKPQARVFQRQ